MKVYGFRWRRKYQLHFSVTDSRNPTNIQCNLAKELDEKAPWMVFSLLLLLVHLILHTGYNVCWSSGFNHFFKSPWSCHLLNIADQTGIPAELKSNRKAACNCFLSPQFWRNNCSESQFFAALHSCVFSIAQFIDAVSIIIFYLSWCMQGWLVNDVTPPMNDATGTLGGKSGASWVAELLIELYKYAIRGQREK